MRLKWLAIGIILLLVVIWLQKYGARIEIENVKRIVLGFGILAPIIFILFNTLSVTVSPIPGFPFWFAGLAIFGFPIVGFYILAGNLIGATLNFWIARRFVRPVVVKLVGRKAMKKVDEISGEIGWQMLLITRLFIGQFFDLVSYAAGFTPMTFKTYFLVTFLGETPLIFLNLYLFEKAAGNLVFLGVAAAVGYILMLVSPAMFYFRKRASFRRQKTE